MIISAIFILIISLFLLYARFVSTTGLIVKEYRIKNTNLPNNFYGLKIVHLSDLHYGRTTKKKQLDNMVKQINLLKPDVVILSGDLIDRDTKLNNKIIEEITTSLKGIKVTLNKYAIMGNHDFKFKQWSLIIENSEFTNLDDTYNLIYKDTNEPILITGLSTNIEKKTKISVKMKAVNTYLDTFKTKELRGKDPKYKILVLHEPDFIDKFNVSDYDLILAGHSHNGQIRLPIIGAVILPAGSKEYYAPYYKLPGGDLFISSGVGTSVASFRFLNRPSINLYRLTNK